MLESKCKAYTFLNFKLPSICKCVLKVCLAYCTSFSTYISVALTHSRKYTIEVEVLTLNLLSTTITKLCPLLC